MNHSNSWKELKNYAKSKGITISYLAHAMKTYRSNLIDKYGYTNDKKLYKELREKVDQLSKLQMERKEARTDELQNINSTKNDDF